ncbi:MAG: hypothetical protein RBT80_15120 [Candidatus Vecturithrix sp.]|jgi:hypothetical protein|nr:hypothetical protein [Candidatus Vecturithrix sp.]
MKKYRNVQILSRCLTFVGFIVGFLLLSSSLSFAHSPILLIEDNEDGTILVMAGFSNGDSAAGKQIQLKSQASGAVLWEGTLEQKGELICPKQTEPYTVYFNGGPGHTIEKPGTLPREGEAVPAQATQAVQTKPDAATGTSSKHPGEAIQPIPSDKYLALSADFDEPVKSLLPNSPLTFRQENGELRTTDIMQGYQYHHQSGLKEILAKLEEKTQAGKKVEMAINPVGLCFGVTTGYLALEYAVRELYGDEIPTVNDFTITTKTKMGGVWDTWDMCFGKRLSRQGAEFGIAPKAYVFTAERLSSGHKLVFAYSKTLSEEIKHLGEAQQKPENFPDQEFQKVKQSLITTLLTRRSQGDFGYFEVVEKNY